MHDMQNYFLGFFPEGSSPRVELVSNVAALRTRCAELGIPVFYTAQPGRMTEQQRGLLMDVWGPGMTDSPQDRDIITELTPVDADQVLVKWRYSAFHHSRLLDQLTSLGRDQLVVCGVYAHVGCLVTANDAFSNGVQPFLVADAIADFTREYHLLALDYARRLCAATPDTATVLTWLS
ncbi:isochorismatase family protein [Acrocarpospora catenulata]|uniref:isochorismatase family protein n=1 Tax=Acrocarpospora catenulata TaxID=2836182 RepID=UPI0027E1EBB8|nr:isochorismatase family protein [Acrocarpospora catenulata]